MLFKKLDKILFYAFIVAEVIIYLTFLFADSLNSFDTTYLKYSGIIVCFIFSIIFTVLKRRKVWDYFMPIALAFTLISDYFLLVQTEYDKFIYGLITFIFVQIFYALYLLKDESDNKRKAFLYVFAFRIIIIVIAYSLGFTVYKDYSLEILAGAYFINLIINFIECFLLKNKEKAYLIMSLGFFLFIMCDINVGLYNVDINGVNKEIPNFLMWFFYLPSQVILSSINYYKNK